MGVERERVFVPPNKFIFHGGRFSGCIRVLWSFGEGAGQIKVKYAGLLLKHGSRVSR